MHSLVLQVDPVPASRPRVTRNGITYYAEPYRSFKNEVPKVITAVWDDDPIVADVKVTIRCFVKRPKTTKLTVPRPDVDNFAKAVLDAMNGIVLADDRQVVELVATKAWAAVGEEGRVEVTIE